jgi:Fe-S oxidoreductase
MDGERDWAQRFKVMRIRRALPGLLPLTFYIPLKELPRFYEECSKMKRPSALACHLVTRQHVLVLCFLSLDKTTGWTCLASLSNHARLSKAALRLGGIPGGGIGLWNIPFRKAIRPSEDLKEMGRIKKELDPYGILNPGMWIHPPPIFVLYRPIMVLLSIFEALTPLPTKRGDEKEIERCVQCGNCVDSCPTRGTWPSTTPRGRIFFARRQASLEGVMRIDYTSSLFNCTLCGRCTVDCSVDIDLPKAFLDLRSHMVREGLEPEALRLLTSVIEGTRNVAGKKNEQRPSWAGRLNISADLKGRKVEYVYFVGCLTSFYPMVQDIARSFVQILSLLSVDFSILGGEEWCCGYPLLSAGHSEEAARFMAHNVEAIRGVGAQKVLVSCPGCLRMWKEYGRKVSGIHVLHATEFIALALKERKFRFRPLDSKVTYHDPCDLGRMSGLYDEPRYILKSIPGLSLVEMEETREYSRCCGSGGDLLPFNQNLSMEIAEERLRDAAATGATTLVTACPACIRAFGMARTRTKIKIELLDVTQLFLRAVERHSAAEEGR